MHRLCYKSTHLALCALFIPRIAGFILKTKTLNFFVINPDNEVLYLQKNKRIAQLSKIVFKHFTTFK